MKSRLVSVSTYLLLAGPLLGHLIFLPTSSFYPFTVLALLIVINSQLRRFANRSIFILASLLLDVPLLAYISLTYGGPVFLILFSSLIDATLKLKSEANPIALYLGTGLLYLVNKTYSWEMTLIIGLVYLAFFLLLLEQKHQFAIRMETEALYDQIRRTNYELERARSRLLEYSRQVEKVSQLEERNRISRELHDSIGHRLTGLLMELDAARQVIAIDFAKGTSLLDSAYANVNQSIETLRTTVRNLRPVDYQNHVTALRELVEEFARTTGVRINLRFSGTPFKLFPSIETVLCRNTQEALTNSVRHGHAHTIDIHLHYQETLIKLEISDNGVGSIDIQKGFGLSGMEERLDLIGGEISYSGVNGFQIRMNIPITREIFNEGS